MRVINARNVHEALPEGVRLLLSVGREEDSRNGKVLVVPEPVTTAMGQPRERVLYWPARDANPFFHLVEGIWMLAGRCDVKSLTRYVTRMESFANDGELWGAYGLRWRFGDQLNKIVDILKKDPNSRRAVLQMWNLTTDLGNETKNDIPCNTHVYFSASSGVLRMTVCCRSNDAIWGAHGANAVHFSMLQEWVSSAIGMPIGGMWQVSHNYHAYLDTLDKVKCLADESGDPYRTRSNPYLTGEVKHYKMVNIDHVKWLREAEDFMDGNYLDLVDPFFNSIALPMVLAHKRHKDGNTLSAIKVIQNTMPADSDWAVAGVQWLERRLK